MDIVIVKPRHELGGYRQFSGSSEAESRKYRLHIGKSGRRWLVGDVANAAEAVYVEGGPNSQGFAGRELTFPLVDGGEVKLKGPWHTTADSLLKDTGVDVRHLYYTFCVIAKKRIQEPRPPRGIYSQTVLIDVLYIDDKPKLSTFDRPEIQEMAKAFAIQLGHSVQLHKETHGGSSTGPVDPNDRNHFVPMP